MITFDGIEVDASIYDIIHLLKEQLNAEGIMLLGAIRDTPDNLMISCPYHKMGQERRPSAGIKKKDGTFHCFACEEVHTLPEVISHCFGKEDAGAFGYSWLMKNFVMISKEDRRDVELDFVRPESVVGRISSSGITGRSSDSINCLGEDNSLGCVNEDELERYRVIHPYWAKRGITNPDVIELFDLGYDKETDCITFPVRDINGRCLFVARRSVKTKFFNYPAGAEKPLYGLYELCTKTFAYRTFTEFRCGDVKLGVGDKLYELEDNIVPNEVIITESMLDALSFWCIGKPALALNGLGNELQFQQLRDLPHRHIILATDMDKAGMQARERIKKNVTSKLITEYFFPKGKKDANECTPEELLALEDLL